MPEKILVKSKRFPLILRTRMSALPLKTDQFFSKERTKIYPLLSPPQMDDKNRQTVFHHRCHETKDHWGDVYKAPKRMTKIPELVMSKDAADGRVTRKNKPKVNVFFFCNTIFITKEIVIFAHFNISLRRQPIL